MRSILLVIEPSIGAIELIMTMKNQISVGSLPSYEYTQSATLIMDENRMTATVRIFQVGEKLYKHVINTQFDSVELRDENEAVLLNYGTDARVTNHAGRVGSFYAEYIEGQPRWVYYEMPLETRTVFGPDLSSAEVEVSKLYIGGLGFATTEPGQLGASLFSPFDPAGRIFMPCI